MVELVVAIGLLALVGTIVVSGVSGVMKTSNRLMVEHDLVEKGVMAADSVEAAFRAVLEYGGALTSISDGSVAGGSGSYTASVVLQQGLLTLTTDGYTGHQVFTFPQSPYRCQSVLVSGRVGGTLTNGSSCPVASVDLVVFQFTLGETVTGESKTFQASFRTGTAVGR